MLLSDVKDIHEVFANETIVEAKKWNDLKAWFGFSGGNVAITVTGFLRGDNRRYLKAQWELTRNWQALLANIPGEIYNTGMSIGQVILWAIVTFMFPFISDMCYQLSMVIKTMEFEDSPDHNGMYAYSITFEKLSWGIIQFAVDLLLNPNGVFILPTPSGMSGLSALDLAKENMSGADNPVGEIIEADSLPEPVEISFDLGQLVTTITDVSQEFPNMPESYDIKPDIDRTLEWMKLPFLITFPQSFSFDLGDHRYEMFWGIYDVINDDDDTCSYLLRVKIKKDGEYIYYGKITEQMQFIFGGSINIYISEFTVSQSDDNQMIFSIAGMVADSA